MTYASTTTAVTVRPILSVGPGVTKPAWYWDYDNVSSGTAQVGDVVTQLDNATPGDESANPNVLLGGTMWYSTYALGNTGQIVLYCDPDSVTGS